MLKKIKLEGQSPEPQDLQLAAQVRDQSQQQAPPQPQAQINSTNSTNTTNNTSTNASGNNAPNATVQPNVPNGQPVAGTPPNFCNICNKELCNKYFMKTHMQKMHGINLGEGGSGVMCDICQKMLCSKYFLKVHKSNTHGVTDYSGPNSAGSQAAIALANTLTNAQKCAALNLALNQHQLQQQSRVQAAALMNAAAFSPLSQLSAANVAALQAQQAQQQQQQQQHQPQPLLMAAADLNSQHSQIQTNSPTQQQQQQRAAAPQRVSPFVTFPEGSDNEDEQARQNGALNEQDEQQDEEEEGDEDLEAPGEQMLFHEQDRMRNGNERQQANPLNDLEAQLHNRQAIFQAVARNPAAAAAMLACAAASQAGAGAPAANLSPATNFNALNQQQQQQLLGAPLMNNLMQQQQQGNQFQTQNIQSPLNLGNLLGATTTLKTTGSGRAPQSPQVQQQQQQQQPNQTQNTTSQNTGNNNNNSGSTNNGTNSRYLRHYTEACNICDRRFKSIKWLQSHVMNDHKNEIENLFNVLVQLLICGMNNNNQNQNQNSATPNSNNLQTSAVETAAALSQHLGQNPALLNAAAAAANIPNQSSMHLSENAASQANHFNHAGHLFQNGVMASSLLANSLSSLQTQGLCNNNNNQPPPPNHVNTSTPNLQHQQPNAASLIAGLLGAPGSGLAPHSAASFLPQHQQQQQQQQQLQQLQMQQQHQRQQSANQFIGQVQPIQVDSANGGQQLQNAVGLSGTLASLIGLQQQLRLMQANQQQQQHNQLVQQPPQSQRQRQGRAAGNSQTSGRRRVGATARNSRAQTARNAPRQRQQQQIQLRQLQELHFQQQQQATQVPQAEQQEQPLSLTTTPTSQSPGGRMSRPDTATPPGESGHEEEEEEDGDLNEVASEQEDEDEQSRGSQTPQFHRQQQQHFVSTTAISSPLSADAKLLARSPSCEPANSPPPPTQPPAQLNHNLVHNHHHIELLFENLNRNH